MPTANASFDNLVKKYFNLMVERNPTFATFLGIHKYDGIMPDESRERILEDIKLDKEFLAKFKRFNPKRLSQDRALDRDLALHILKLDLFYMTQIRGWERSPDAAEYIGDSIFLLFARDFAPPNKRIPSITSRLEQSGRIVEQIRKRTIRPVKLWTEIAIESCDHLPAFLRALQKWAYKQSISQKEKARLDRAIENTVAIVSNYKNTLKYEILPKSKDDWAIGKKKFDQLIRMRELGLSTSAIYKIGQMYLDQEKRNLIKIARHIKPDASVATAKKMVENKRPRDFETALRFYRNSIFHAKRFLKKKKLVTFPRESLIVIPTPEYLRPTHPFAAYYSPAKFDPKPLGIYIVTPVGTKAGVGKRHNYASITNTSVHEAYPGHHLQLSAANTNRSPLRQLAHATEFVEGWAHYCEEAMSEWGFDRSPEVQFVRTQDMIWRAVRIIVDIGIHTGKMSFNEAVNFMVKQIGMEKDAAIAEVKRYTASPTYQLSYLLGKHLLKQLKADVKKKMGSRFSDRFFNDTAIYAGSLPLRYMRMAFEQKIGKLR